MSISAYPLQWPDNLQRTSRKASSKFSTQLNGALKNVSNSLRLFASDSGKKIDNLIISSNVTLGDSKPADTGVAVWFTWDEKQVCIAVDRYPKVSDNLQAIHHIVEARRTELRHGGLEIVRATFRGFQALPAPAGNEWWEVLEVDPTATADQIQAAYKEKAKTMHPDKGGSDPEFQRLQDAKEKGLKEAMG